MNKIFPWILCLVLLFWVLLERNGKSVPKEDKVVKSDTTYIVKVDTIHDSVPLYIPEYDTKYIKDTIYLDRPTSIIPREVRHYSMEGIYDLDISGYEPTLDDIKVYRKTEYVNRTETIKEHVYSPKLYLGMGFLNYKDTFVPTLGLSYSSPKRWLFGADFSMYRQKPIVNFSIKYNLLNR